MVLPWLSTFELFLTGVAFVALGLLLLKLYQRYFAPVAYSSFGHGPMILGWMLSLSFGALVLIMTVVRILT